MVHCFVNALNLSTIIRKYSLSFFSLTLLFLYCFLICLCYFVLFYLGTRLYREPASKSNRSIVLNAIEYVVFPGVVNAETRNRVLVKKLACFTKINAHLTLLNVIMYNVISLLMWSKLSRLTSPKLLFNT